ncbi:MAG: respiratory nitrate reductase subunit gamma, partial [Calditrichaeota bacterium]|nr:respiratory nitrate reductase subunit gamma [Calditrichota bacterium]
RQVLLFNARPLRLYLLEITGLIFGLLTLVGLIAIIVRRVTAIRVKVVTTWTDWVLYGLLLVQVVSGIGVAVIHGWGSSWFAAAMTPYLWSLVMLQPQTAYVTALPFLVKLHLTCAWLLIGFFPFTRLVHVLVVPNPYLWRRTQVVRWYRK